MKLLIIFSINRIATPILVYYFVLSILSLYTSLSLSLSLCVLRTVCFYTPYPVYSVRSMP